MSRGLQPGRSRAPCRAGTRRHPASAWTSPPSLPSAARPRQTLPCGTRRHGRRSSSSLTATWLLCRVTSWQQREDKAWVCELRGVGAVELARLEFARGPGAAARVCCRPGGRGGPGARARAGYLTVRYSRLRAGPAAAAAPWCPVGLLELELPAAAPGELAAAVRAAGGPEARAPWPAAPGALRAPAVARVLCNIRAAPRRLLK
jgi:hypothetical protein